MTQNERILKHLKSGSSLSPIQAWNWWNVMHLASRICELRQDGYQIITEKDQKRKFARYHLLNMVES